MPNPKAIEAGLPELELQLQLQQEKRLAVPRYPDDPVAFIEDVLGEFMWSAQRKVAEALLKHRRVAVATAHSVGKSWLAARLVAWWISEHDDPFAATTAPRGPQVKAILWKEIGRAHAKGGLPGRLNLTEWYLPVKGTKGKEELVGYGRKPSEYDMSAFQGTHARFVLGVLDEACGVPETLFTAMDTLTSGGDSRLLAIGNPDDPASHFARICRPGSGWHVIHISAFDSPNFTKEKVPDEVKAMLLSRSWVEEKEREWGKDSPLYISKVLGRFPKDASDGVVPLSFVARCQHDEEDRHYSPDDLLPVELGVDVGAGGDLTVVRERRGILAGRTWRERTPEAPQASGLVMKAIHETGATRVKVDKIGVGWGIVGRLQELREQGEHDAEIVAVNVSEASTEPKKFPNLRSQLWWEVGRQLSQDAGWDLTDVEDDTIAQLIAPKYKLDSAGRTVVEKKEEMIKRIEHSPDDADALLLAFFTDVRRNIEAY